MSFGTFYAVPDGMRQTLTGLYSLPEWYDALDQFGIEDAPQLDTGEAIQYGWQWALEKQPAPLGLMFQGELAPEASDCDDPDVAFLGRDLVKQMAATLAAHDEAFFGDLLHTPDGDSLAGQLWLLAPMREFFSAAATRGDAIIVLWGG